MTSDAKIGLLLGLVFIFIIAFVINGLPRFRDALSRDEIATAQELLQDDPITSRERNAREVWEDPIIDEQYEESPTVAEQDAPGYETPWPDDTIVERNNHVEQARYPEHYYYDIEYEDTFYDPPSYNHTQVADNESVAQDFSISPDQEEIRDYRPFPALSSEELQNSNPQNQNRDTTPYAGRGYPNQNGARSNFPNNMRGRRQGNQSLQPGQSLTREQQNRQEQPSQPSQPANTNQSVWPKKYVIQEGDNNLSKIAKKFYGEQEGNRIVNVKKIYEANRNVLKSEDEIFVGQEISIPKPAAPESNPQPGDVLNGQMFRNVTSMGASRLDTGRWYVVKENDSLWKIAAEELGQGARFTEISKLNADILTDENKLKPGMRLLLPDE